MKLTRELVDLIVAYVRAGVYPHVAAEAAGASPRDFRRWLKRGRKRKARDPYRSFAARIVQAAAQCRAAAEMEVRKNGSLNWLKYGPGKERPRRPGWTTTARPYPVESPEGDAPSALADTQVIARLLEALSAFPEARVAAARALAARMSSRSR